VASFTSLAGRREREEERPAHDEVVVVAVPEPEPEPELPVSPPVDGATSSIRDFPRGSRAGTVLHTLFEELEFTAPAPERDRLVERLLLQHNLDISFQTPVAEMLHQVLHVPLPGLHGPLRLGDVGPGDRLCELEFFLPLQPLTTEQFSQLLKGWQHACPDLAAVAAELEFTAVRGFLRGFIDLVFCHQGCYYLVDWKSNHLGMSLADYTLPRLAQEMRHHSYPLQYLLYTVALHRFLSLRLPDYDYDRHVGGAFYLFLRGVDATNGGSTGVYADRLPRALVEAVTAMLSGAAGGTHAA
jgi:exodeoxyribonuclease V beta subunit